MSWPPSESWVPLSESCVPLSESCVPLSESCVPLSPPPPELEELLPLLLPLLPPLLPLLLLLLPPLLLGSIGSWGIPLLLPLPLLLLPLLLLLLLETATASHLPLLHSLEQQSPYWVHVSPFALHDAVGPPQKFFRQSFLQQSDSALHALPSAPQLGATHVPPVQLPLQQSLGA
jgi:hypothetical protein